MTSDPTPPKRPADADDVARAMREFWDEKARENAWYYVSSYRDYDDVDPDEFFRWGEILTQRFLEQAGVEWSGRESVLEIGCGVGRMTAALARRFARVIALDVAPGMLERAREHLREAGNVEFVLGNGTDLAGVADESVDLVFSYIVLQHIPDPRVTEAYLREMGRVLRPGGYAWFQCNNLPRRLRERLVPAPLRRLARRALEGLRTPRGSAGDDPHAEAAPARGPTGLDHPAWVGSRMSLGRIRRALRRGGLQPLRTEGEGTQYLWVLARKPARMSRSAR